ncbi:MAG: hypothetical protein ACYC8T_37110, partial [Myxococcaceae bacterium]
MSDSPEKGRGAGPGLSLLAAGAPAVFLGAFLAGAVAVSGPSDIARFLQEGGAPGYLVLFVSAAAAVGCALAVYFCARGTGLPAAVPALLAGLPWVAGGAGTLHSVRYLEQALGMVNPADKAIIAAAGISEVLSVRLLGAWCGSALLAGVAVGLGAAAVGRASSNGRGASALGSLLGAALALPMLGLAVLSMGGLGTLAAPVGAAALAAVLACGFAGAALRWEEDDAPTVRLAAAAAACAGLAFVASALVPGPAIERQVLAALASVDPADRLAMLMRGIDTLASVDPAGRLTILAGGPGGSVPARLLAWPGSLLALLPLAAVALWGASRSEVASVPVRAVAFVLVAFAFLGIDRLAAARPLESIRLLAGAPWSDLPGFQPSRIQAWGEGEEVRLLVTATEVLAPASGRPPVPLGASADEALLELLRKLRVEAHPRFGDRLERPPEWLRTLQEPRLVMAVDARVTGAALKRVLEAAQQAVFHSVVFAGEDPAAGKLRVAGTALPLLAAYWRQRSSQPVLFAAVVQEASAALDPILWHGTAGAGDSVRFDPRSGSTAGTRLLVFGPDGSASMPRPSEETGGEYPAYVQLDPGVTPEGLARVVSALDKHGYLPVLALGEVPGEPEQALSVGPREPLLPMLQANPKPLVMGSLDKEVIRKVVHRYTAHVRYCYESAL